MPTTSAEAATKAEALKRLPELEVELLAWCHPTAPKSHWNDVHGSVTGDYVGMYEAAARADAAEIEKLTASVLALRLLAGLTEEKEA